MEIHKKSKSALWQALALTVVVFLFGMFLGVAYEGNKVDQVNEYYAVSEILLMDAFAIGKLPSSLGDSSCEVLLDANKEFADRIFMEAQILERYESSGKLTDTLKLTHKRYDLLRTLLWINLMDIPSKCKNDVSVVVYLYEYDTPDLTKRATNVVWSRVLSDLKNEVGGDIVLVPIAADSGLTSLNSLIYDMNVTSYPSLVIDNKYVISDLKSVEELKTYLK